MNRYVIIGGGPAGYASAKALSQEPCEVALICGEGMLPYNRPQLSKMLADTRTSEDIALFRNGALPECIEPIYSSAAAIDAKDKRVVLSNGESRLYDKLLIATGANAFDPIARTGDAIPSAALRNYADLLRLREIALTAKRAVIIGGGILGIEAAVALKQRGISPVILEYGERIIAAQADEGASALFKEALERAGIEVYVGARVVGIDGAGVRTDGGHMPADMAIVSAGIRSECAIALSAGVLVERGIVVNNQMRTSISDVFAAGDCAQYEGRVSGLVSAALEMGRVAARAMAGGNDVYIPPVPATMFDELGIKLFSAGRYSDASLARAIPGEGYARVYIESGMLVGAVLMGDIKMAPKLLAAIKRGANEADAMAILNA